MQPILVINPRSDTAFVDQVNAELVGVQRPEDLAKRLRAWYPDVVVRPRELSSEPAAVWYVFRDGHWTSEDVRRGG